MRTGAEVEPCGHRPGPPGATEAGRGGNLLSAQALMSDFWPPKAYEGTPVVQPICSDFLRSPGNISKPDTVRGSHHWLCVSFQ